jgi:hypothetical protein
MTRRIPMQIKPQLAMGSRTVLDRLRYFFRWNSISGEDPLKNRYPEMTLKIGTEHLKKFSTNSVIRAEYGWVSAGMVFGHNFSAPSNSL